jgi:hypothetical protein
MNYLDWVDAYQQLDRYVDNKRQVITHPISKQHDTRIADIEVICYPKTINWLRSAEGSCSWMCSGVLYYHFPHVKTIFIG